MAIMDPLLNTGFLWRCLAAYAGIKADNEQPNDELPKTTLVTSDETYYTRLGFFFFDPSFRRHWSIDLGEIMGSRQAFLLRKLRQSSLPDHPYMSPLRASDEILRQFPTTFLIVSDG